MLMRMAPWLVFLFTAPALSGGQAATELCLEGELDLGVRYQGLGPLVGERVPTTWCVVTESDSDRVRFRATGKSNPDLDGSWAVAYDPPDLVRIVNRDSPPDLEFLGTNNAGEASSVRHMDPLRLAEDLRRAPNSLAGLEVEVREGRVRRVVTSADLPLRGRVPVIWTWSWEGADAPRVEVTTDGEVLFRAAAHWRDLEPEEARSTWTATAGSDPIQLPGDRWPARVAMELVPLAEDVYLVRGVRTGFQHLVVDTDVGLVVADAPAGWVELHQLPPSDLVPGLGISGLSERLVDFLRGEFPDRPIRAVVLTHFHDDHAGGARAFAAVGAEVYAASASAAFLETAFNRATMPEDRLTRNGGSVRVVAVAEPVVIGSAPRRVEIVPMGASPHVGEMLGVRAIDRGYFFVSDVHAPDSDAPVPRANRAASECWFARWATRNLASGVRVVNSHTVGVTSLDRLRRYLESPQCEELVKSRVDAADFLVFGGAGDDRGVDVIQTRDGGYLVVGVVSTVDSDEDVLVLRLDPSGAVVWNRALGGLLDDAGWSVVETEEGFVIAGFSATEGGDLDCSLWAIDGQGRELWSNRIGSASDERCWAIARDPLGGFALAGETGYDTAGERDCYLVHTDALGRPTWSRTFGGSADDRCFSLAATGDAGWAIAGQTFSEGAGDRDAWILVAGAGGELRWSKTYGGAASDVAHSVVADDGGTVWVVGYTTSLAESPDDPLVWKLAADGSASEPQVVTLAGFNRILGGALASGGGLCLSGATVAGEPRLTSALAVRVDADATVEWIAEIASTGNGDSVAYGILGTVDGGCAIAGHTTVGSAGGRDLLFARFDRSGAIVPPRHASRAQPRSPSLGGGGAER